MTFVRLICEVFQFKNYANLAKVSINVILQVNFYAYMPKNIYFWTINFKNMRLIGILVPLLSFLLGGCGRNEEYEPVEISRLDQTLPAGVMPDNAEELNAAKALFKLSGYGELNDSSLAVYSGSPSIKLHTEILDKFFSDISDVEAGLGKMFGRMERICPEIIIPKVYAIISPFNQSVFTVDTLLYIGVNHYLGLGYKPYDYFPEFIRRTKVRERIVPDVAETLIRKYYEYKPSGDYPTLLSRLLYEGAIVDAVMRLTGQTEREVLGYDEKEMEWLEDNEKKIWETLMTRKMLYSTDETLAMRLISPSASTSVLNVDAPGRAGRYVGYRIVREYLKHNDVAPDRLLTPQFYDSPKALRESRYH